MSESTVDKGSAIWCWDLATVVAELPNLLSEAGEATVTSVNERLGGIIRVVVKMKQPVKVVKGRQPSAGEILVSSYNLICFRGTPVIYLNSLPISGDQTVSLSLEMDLDRFDNGNPRLVEKRKRSIREFAQQMNGNWVVLQM